MRLSIKRRAGPCGRLRLLRPPTLRLPLPAALRCAVLQEMTEAQLEGFFMWLPAHCNPNKSLRFPGGFIRVKHTEWKRAFGY